MEQPVKNNVINVGVTPFGPLVTSDNGKFSGFEIELWKKIAEELKWKFKYTEKKFSELLSAVQNNEFDVGIAGVTVTADRESNLDFSHHTFDSGLHMIVPTKTHTTIRAAIRSVFTRDIRKILAIVLSFVVIAGHAMWLSERGGDAINNSFAISNDYIPGIFEAFWWAVATVSTVGYGDFVPVTWAGRAVGSLVILVGLAIFGLYVARVSSTITMRELKTDINSHWDLRNKKVATVQNTISAKALKKVGAEIVPVNKIEEAYNKLVHGEVEVVVFDAPVLLHYASHKGTDKVRVVGGMFRPQSYGFAFPEGSQLREQVNRVLLRLRESGYYKALYSKWFGEQD